MYAHEDLNEKTLRMVIHCPCMVCVRPVGSTVGEQRGVAPD